MQRPVTKILAGFIFALLLCLGLSVAPAAAGSKQVTTYNCTRTGSNDPSPPEVSATTTRASSYANCGRIGAAYNYSNMYGTFTTGTNASDTSTATRSGNCNCNFNYSVHYIGLNGTGPWGSSTIGFTTQP